MTVQYSEKEFENLVFKSKEPFVLDEDFLRQCNADCVILETDPYGLFPPIIWAAKNGHLEVMIFIVENDLDQMTEWERPIIQTALSEGHMHIVKYFFESSEIVIDWNNALLYASSKGILVAVKYLVENGVDTRFAIEKATYNKHIDVVKYLLSTGIYPEADIHKFADELTCFDTYGSIEDLLTDYVQFSYTKAIKN